MRAVDDLEHAETLDGLVGVGQRWARLLRPGRCRDALYGVWLGHPLHPVLAQAPIGLWLSATVLDVWPGDGERASRRLVLAGLAAAVPAALAGAVDWSEQHEQQMRVGTVHAMANGAAVGLYTASLAARTRSASRVLRLAGLATAGVAGLLGGHISFRLAGGANQAEPVPHLVQPGWHDLMPAAELSNRSPVKRMLGEVPVVVVRDGREVHVLAERCSHLSGPLSEGELAGGCLTCPWHGSVFRVSDGAVVHGPATAPQPAFQARVTGGVIQVCLPGAG
jgi:nitrite reductase/ring-hydroxylating ferredoxin subunit